MSGFIVFGRFFPGFADHFPFDRFVTLPDSEVNGEFEALCREWWDAPANRARVQAARKADAEEVHRWEKACAPRPTHRVVQESATDASTEEKSKGAQKNQGSHRSEQLSPEVLSALKQRFADPPLQPIETHMPEYGDLISYAGWGQFSPSTHSRYGITRRYPVKWCATKEAADAAAQLLHARVSELLSATSATCPISDLNPRFVAVPQSSMPPPEQSLFRDQIARLSRDRVGPITEEEAYMRACWPALVSVLEHVDSEMPPPTDRSAVPASQATNPPRIAKKSTQKGEGEAKLIAALTHHHKYNEDGCLNLEPIGNNELARRAEVKPSTASEFFKKHFKGHSKYTVVCRDGGRLAESLKVLNKDFSPHDLYGRRPVGEDSRENT